MDLDQTQAIPCNYDYDDNETDDETSQTDKKPIAYIKVLSHKDVSEEIFPLFEGDNVIGRQEGCNVCIPVKALSKQHACIEIRRDSYLIYDRESRNKTRRGKLFLTPNVRYELKHNDHLVLADINCIFQIKKEIHNAEISGSETGSESTLPVENVMSNNSRDKLMSQTIIVDEDEDDERSNDSIDLLQEIQACSSNVKKTEEKMTAPYLFSAENEDNTNDKNKSKVAVEDTPIPNKKSKNLSTWVLAESESDEDDSPQATLVFPDDDSEESADTDLLIAPTQAFLEESVLEKNSEDEDNAKTNILLEAETQMFSDIPSKKMEDTESKKNNQNNSKSAVKKTNKSNIMEMGDAKNLDINENKMDTTFKDEVRGNVGQKSHKTNLTADKHQVTDGTEHSESTTQEFEEDKKCQNELSHLFNTSTLACDMVESETESRHLENKTNQNNYSLVLAMSTDERHKGEDSTPKIGNEDVTEIVVNNEAATQIVGNEDATQVVVDNEDDTQIVSYEDATQIVGNEDATQIVGNEDPTQVVIGNEDATQIIGNEDATQIVGNEDPTQVVIGNEDATQIIGNEDATQIVDNEDATEIVSYEDATQIIGNEDATQIVDNEDATEIVSYEDATQIIGNEDATQIVGNEDATEIVSNEGDNQIVLEEPEKKVKGQRLNMCCLSDDNSANQIHDRVSDTATEQQKYLLENDNSREKRDDEPNQPFEITNSNETIQEQANSAELQTDHSEETLHISDSVSLLETGPTTNILTAEVAGIVKKTEKEKGLKEKNGKISDAAEILETSVDKTLPVKTPEKKQRGRKPKAKNEKQRKSESLPSDDAQELKTATPGMIEDKNEQMKSDLSITNITSTAEVDKTQVISDSGDVAAKSDPELKKAKKTRQGQGNKCTKTKNNSTLEKESLKPKENMKIPQYKLEIQCRRSLRNNKQIDLPQKPKLEIKKSFNKGFCCNNEKNTATSDQSCVSSNDSTELHIKNRNINLKMPMFEKDKECNVDTLEATQAYSHANEDVTESKTPLKKQSSRRVTISENTKTENKHLEATTVEETSASDMDIGNAVNLNICQTFAQSPTKPSMKMKKTSSKIKNQSTDCKKNEIAKQKIELRKGKKKTPHTDETTSKVNTDNKSICLLISRFKDYNNFEDDLNVSDFSEQSRKPLVKDASKNICDVSEDSVEQEDGFVLDELETKPTKGQKQSIQCKLARKRSSVKDENAVRQSAEEEKSKTVDYNTLNEPVSKRISTWLSVSDNNATTNSSAISQMVTRTRSFSGKKEKPLRPAQSKGNKKDETEEKSPKMSKDEKKKQESIDTRSTRKIRDDRMIQQEITLIDRESSRRRKSASAVNVIAENKLKQVKLDKFTISGSGELPPSAKGKSKSKSGIEKNACQIRLTRTSLESQSDSNSVAVAVKDLGSSKKTNRKRLGQENSQEDVSTPRKIAKSLARETRSTRTATQNTGSTSLRYKSLTCKPKIMFTGVVDEQGEKVVHELGGELAATILDCTHLVTDKVRRTVKFLGCLARGLPIVSPQWLQSCKDAGTFIEYSTYLISDNAAEQQYKFSLKRSIENASNKQMLKDYRIHVTKSVRPDPTQMKEILQCTGAKYLAALPKKEQEMVIVISCEDDKAACKPALKAGIPIVSAEFILTGILRQELDIKNHKLFADACLDHEGPRPKRRKR